MENSDSDTFALITGCGKGSIGEALARELLNRGLSVISTVLPGEDSSHLNLPRCHIYELDVTDGDSVAELHRSVKDLTGDRLDILGNNAGIGYKYPAVDTELAMAEKLLAVHVLGPMRMVQQFHPMLIRAKGIVFNTCSISAVFPTVYSAAYGASKAALYHYGNILRIELAPLGVRVVNILAGEVHTNISKSGLDRVINDDSVYASMQVRFKAGLGGAKSRMTPQHFAKGVCDNLLAAKPDTEYWRGTSASVVKLMYRFLPRSFMEYLAFKSNHLDELKL